MKRFRYETGVVIQIDGQKYRFINRTRMGVWQLVELSTNTVEARRTEELDALYVSGHLILDPEQDRPRPTSRGFASILPAGIEDLPEPAKKRVADRQHVLDEVQRMTHGVSLGRKVTWRGKEVSILVKILAEVCEERGIKTISAMTYYRWRKVISDGGSAIDLQGGFGNKRRSRIHPFVRKIIVEEMSDALKSVSDKSIVGAPAEIRMEDMAGRIRAKIRAEKLANPTAQLKMPATSTLYNYWNSFSAYERAVAKFGKTRARAMFRSAPGQMPVEMIMDRVEYDETRLPIFIFDEELQIPFGRPWLAWYIDVYSQMPIGFYIGFEPPSDLTTISALRHACIPKSYAKIEYPKLQNDYLGAGLPNFLVFDNGLTQRGKSIRQVTSEFTCHYDFLPVRTPWFKPVVEGMFNVLNQELLRLLPGFVLGKIDSSDYNPLESGCLGFRHFLTIFHHWLIDYYCQAPTGDSKLSPAKRWADCAAEWRPDQLPRASDLDAVFGIVREGNLDHRGVVFEKIRYYSDDLHAYRYQFGNHTTVRIKLNPSDMGKIYVWLPIEKHWIAAYVVPQMRARAQGRSLHCIKIINKYMRDEIGRNDDHAWDTALMQLQEIIANALPDAIGIQNSSRLARLYGYGTDHIFGNQNIDGELGPLTGPYQGKRLNPDMDSFPAPQIQLQASDESQAPKPQRTIPKIKVDKSLGG